MSVLTKYFSILMLGGMGFFGNSAYALTTTNTDELYSIEFERSSAQIPSSIDTSALNSADQGEEYVVDMTLESMSEVEMKKPMKKISAPSQKLKKSSKN